MENKNSSNLNNSKNEKGEGADGKGPQKSKHKWIFYYFGVLLVTMLLNALLFPSISDRNVTEVGYSEFLNMIESGEVDGVFKDTDRIQFYTEAEDGTVKIYRTGIWPDDSLVDRLDEAGIDFMQEIPTQASPIITFLVNWIMPILMFVVIGQIFSRMMSKRMGGGIGGLGKSSAKVYTESETGKTFVDVAGQEEAKEALQEIVDVLNNPEKYTKIGATLPKGALLVGPPGTGKTLLAKAVAGEAKVPFFSISGSEFVEMFVGMGAAKVRDLFKQANEKAPCIVFVDEIDTIGKKRDNGGLGGNDEREQTLNQLLTEMDGFDGGKGIVVLAATNRPETLDKALLRPGRFDRRIPVELPDQKGREDILKVHSRNVMMASDIDFTAVARATAGASGADLANIVNEAALRAVRDDREEVIQNDLEESVEVVIAGYQRKNATISEKERKIIAYHEVGHALVAALQSDSAPVHKITIIPRTSGALGYTMQVEEQEKFLMSKEQALNKIATYAGGRAAEDLIFNSITTGASNDIEQSTRIARAMVTRYGMSEKFGMTALETVNNQYLGGDTSMICSQETAKLVDEEVMTIIKNQYEKAINILKENETKLHEISAYLLDKETITGEEFMKILKQ